MSNKPSIAIPPAAKRRPWSVGVATAVVISAAVHGCGNPGNNYDAAAFTRAYSSSVLKALDENAILLVENGRSLLPIAPDLVRELRPDVELLQLEQIALSGRNASAADGEAAADAVRDFIRDASRPVYYFGNQPHDYGIEDFGLYKKVRKDAAGGDAAAAKTIFSLPPGGPELLAMLHDAGDALTPQHSEFRRFFIYELARVMVAGGLHQEETQPYLEQLEKSYRGKLELVGQLARDPTPAEAATALQWLEQAEEQFDEGVSVKNRARLYLLRAAMVSWIDAPVDAVEANLLRSLEVDPAPDNPAMKSLHHLYQRIGAEEKAVELARRYNIVVKE